MTPELPGAVFDCMVLLQALIKSSGPAAACMALVDSGRMRLVFSEATLAEAADVLTRPKLQRKFRTLTEERVRAFLEHARAVAHLVPEVPPYFTLPRDPKDEMYVNLVLAAGATYLVTGDNDLLDLMREDLPEGRDFRTRFPSVTILDPVAFLQTISPKGPDGETPGPTAE
jgi:putative PIN family toxin of toxin-antitoxin system